MTKVRKCLKVTILRSQKIKKSIASSFWEGHPLTKESGNFGGGGSKTENSIFTFYYFLLPFYGVKYKFYC
jgi:hypothetical protein